MTIVEDNPTDVDPRTGETFAVDGPWLKKLLSSTTKLSRNTYMPVLSSVKVEPGDGPGRLLFTITDLETTVQADVPAVHDLTGPVVIARKPLADALKQVKGAKFGTVTLELGGKTSWNEDAVTITVGLASIPLHRHPAEEYPSLSVAPIPGQRSLPVDVLGDTARFASADSARPILNCVFFKGTSLVATDSYHLVENVLTSPVADEEGILVPVGSIDIMTKLAGKTPTVWVNRGGAHASFRWADGATDWTVTSRLVEGEFPNFEKLMPPAEDVRWRLEGPRDVFVAGVKALAGGLEAHTPVVVCELDDKTVELRGGTNGLSGKVPLPGVTFRNESVVIGFNPGFLLDILDGVLPDPSGNVAIASGNVAIDGIDALKPVVSDRHLGCTEGANQERSRRLLMPVRTA